MIYINQGHGVFAKPINVNIDANIKDIRFTDINGDGFVDIYEVNGAKHDDTVWINNGKGEF